MDRRTQYTKKIIKEVFIELLNNREINKITVSEICKKADINRATFYRYYLDQYDLLEKIEFEFLEELKNTFMPITDRFSIYSFSKEVLSILIDNRNLISTLFNTNNNIFFLNDFLEVIYDKCKKRWLGKIKDISLDNIEYAATFIFNGTMGIINYWVKNNFEDDPDKVAKNIDTLCNYGINKFIYGK